MWTPSIDHQQTHEYSSLTCASTDPPDQVACGSIVACIDHQVISSHQLQCILWVQPIRVCGDLDAGVEAFASLLCRQGLMHPHTSLGVDDLAMEVAGFHNVMICKADVAWSAQKQWL